MQRTLIEWLAAATVITAGLLCWEAAMPDRTTAVARLRQDTERALANAKLTAEQRQAVDQARATFREMAAARRSGHPVDQERLRRASAMMRSVFESPAIREDDRRRVEQGVRLMRERQEQARRAVLVDQLGYPLGLLVDHAVGATQSQTTSSPSAPESSPARPPA